MNTQFEAKNVVIQTAPLPYGRGSDKLLFDLFETQSRDREGAGKFCGSSRFVIYLEFGDK